LDNFLSSRASLQVVLSYEFMTYSLPKSMCKKYDTG
jgi:hypothetical protein